MTDRELMQQAYAVPLHEQLASVPESARLVIDDQDGMGTRFIPVGRMCHEAAAALRERLAQPEQEPVAWMHPDGRIWTFGRGFDKSTFTIPLYTTPQRREEQEPVATVQRVQDLFIGYLEKSLPVGTPLYTAPPRREWVGLTRDEVLDIEETAKHPLEFARAIEAALREKNNG